MDALEHARQQAWMMGCFYFELKVMKKIIDEIYEEGFLSEEQETNCLQVLARMEFMCSILKGKEDEHGRFGRVTAN